jgi:hypothetical protein
MLLLIPKSQQEFRAAVEIRFNNINEGFSNYKNSMLCSESNSEQSFINFIEKAYELNGEEDCYVDFYFNRLQQEERLRLEQLICIEDKVVLEKLKLEISAETVYFKFTKEVIPFLTRLSTQEVLFSTFYFTKYHCTIWGNYNMKFPMFFNDIDTMEIYKKMASLCNLRLA